MEHKSAFTWAVLGGGATHLTIAFTDNVATPNEVVGGESSDHEVWWFTPGGIWVHNEADDFDAGGRGTVENTVGVTVHTVEVYEIPHNAVAVYVRRIGATALGVLRVLTQVNPAR